MGLLEHILPSKELPAETTVFSDEVNPSEQVDTPKTPSKKTPGILRQLQESLTDQMMSPTSRKRIRSKPSVFEYDTTTKRRVTSSPSQASSRSDPLCNLSTPPSTPQKSMIQKPQISLIRSSPVKSSAVKKLEFSQPSTSHTLSTPPATPVKQSHTKKEPVSSITPSSIKFERDLDWNKENVAPSSTIISPPVTPRKISVYTRAKAYFHRSYKPKDIEHLPARNLEAQALKEFLIENIKTKNSTSLYISGPPGTGKTAQIDLTLSHLIDIESHNAVKPIEIDGLDYKIGYTYINCMTVGNIRGIFSEIFTKLSHKKTSLQDAKNDLLNLISDDSFSDMNIIVLDELDKLITEDQQVLFELFAWTVLEKTNIMLIGISNALDMVDRLLPRLKTNGLNPNTLVFLPYTADQISTIIKSRLRLLNKDPNSSIVPLFHPAAIQLCSKKAASNSGDLRKALDICRNAIELVERGLKSTSSSLLEISSPESIENQKILEYDEANAPQIKISHIAKVCSNMFNQNQIMKLQGLNLQQKVMICMLIKAEEDNPFRTLDLNSFFEYYVKKSNGYSLIGVLKKGEFLEIVSSLESFGVVRISSRTASFSGAKVTSAIIKRDLVQVIENIPVLEELLAGSK